MIDLHPATTALSELVESVRDDQLGAPTPCADTSVAALLDHIDGLAFAFTAAAKKETLPADQGGPSADASHLTPDWRTRIPERLGLLADAWSNASAWDGMTKIAGMDLPAQVAALVAIDEVVVHGWDLAVASDQPFTADAQLVDAANEFVRPQVEEHPEGTP